MTPVLIYILKANLALILFYTGYYLWLRKLTFYTANRFYLLFAIVFSVAFPSLQPEEWFKHTPDIPVNLGTLAGEFNLNLADNRTTFSDQWLTNGIGLGIIIFGILLIIKLIYIGQIHHQSVPASWSVYSFRKSDKIISPFAFLKNIYLNPSLHPSQEFDKIFKHESIHVQKLHSLDILLAELTRVLFWYNPLAWWLGKSIRENIEFMTDEAVLNSGIDRKSYQYSLLQTTGLFQENPLMGSNFNLNHLKTRIMMMNKQKSSGGHLGKYALLVPAIIIGSLAFTISKADHKISSTSPVAISYSTPSDTLKPGKPRPLIIVDGVKMDNMTFDLIDKNRIKSVEVIKDESAVKKYGIEATFGVILVTTKSKEQAETKTEIDNNSPTNIITQLDDLNGEPIIYVNGKRYIKDKMNPLNPDKMQSMNVYKGKSAIEKFGEEGKNGIIDIVLKED